MEETGSWKFGYIYVTVEAWIGTGKNPVLSQEELAFPDGPLFLLGTSHIDPTRHLACPDEWRESKVIIDWIGLVAVQTPLRPRPKVFDQWS